MNTPPNPPDAPPGPASPAMPEVLAEGTVVGRHTVTARLRDGGMAIVYVGQHVETEARVAIKVLRSEFAQTPEYIARFDREAKVMGRLAGCHQIVGVHDVGALPDGRHYTVMDFIRGTDLDDLLAELSSNDETMSLDRLCSIMCDVATGLETAHAKLIVHRDLKPANIMIEQQRTGGETARVVDFGVSADLRADGVAQDLTAAGSVIGTPEYMAPEQAAGVSNVPTVDIYALGVVGLEMLTLRKPPARGWQMQTPRASALRSDVPPVLQTLLDRMLEPNSGQRIQSMTEVRTALESIRRGLPNVSPRSAGSVATEVPGSQQPSPAARLPAPMPAALASVVAGMKSGEVSSRAGAAGATVPAPGRASEPAVRVPGVPSSRGAPGAIMARARAASVVAEAEAEATAPPGQAYGGGLGERAAPGSSAASSPPSRAAMLAAAATREAEVHGPMHAAAPTRGEASRTNAGGESEAEPNRTGVWLGLAALGFAGLLAAVWFLVRP